ncbi:MAG: hypothetical protein ABSE67_19125 [Xanthobacteraceae bacterium]|jgi:hypothetical protein
MTDQVAQVLDYASKVLIFIIFAVLAVNAYLNRNMPRVGGKIGPHRAIHPPAPVPEGFSRVYARAMTIFAASSNAASFPNLKAFLRHGTVSQPTLMRIYRVDGCKTEIEIPADPPDYERIDAAEALALLRELPDLRLVRRLHLSDERSFLDPWVRKLVGQEFFLLGNATNFSLVVLYKPDRRLGRLVGLTLLHEWLHLVAFRSIRHVRRFKRADAIEPLAPSAIEPVSFGDRKTPIYEAWCDLGEKLLGYDETIACDAALTSPVHAIILWQRVEKMLRKTPPRLRSTRFAEFERRAAFMHSEVAPKARAKRARWRLGRWFWRFPWSRGSR